MLHHVHSTHTHEKCKLKYMNSDAFALNDVLNIPEELHKFCVNL